MTTKMTNRELFTALLKIEEVKANPLYVEKINALIEGIDRKNANRKPTAKQTENEAIKEEILTALDTGHGRTVSRHHEALLERCSHLHCKPEAGC